MIVDRRERKDFYFRNFFLKVDKWSPEFCGLIGDCQLLPLALASRALSRATSSAWIFGSKS